MSAHPLDPRGALAVGFGAATGRRDVFRLLGAGAARCDLGDEGLYLAEEIAAAAFDYSEDDRAALACLVLAAQIAARMGATRLPLDKKGPLRDLVKDIVRVSGLDIDEPKLLARMAARAGDVGKLGAVIGGPRDLLPLIVEHGCLYTQRAHVLEGEVARAVAARLSPLIPTEPPDVVPDLLARPAGLALSDEQAAAVATATRGLLAVVSGGPGTGKTQVAGAIVRALARLGCTHIALAAPTGKAAHRLGASVARQLDAIADPAPADLALRAAPLVGQTLHRLLGLRPDAPAAGHDEHDPLPYDAVLVDEASMIDLALAARLLRALRPDARLILLGDARQLPSVDAGQVLADLVAIARAAGPDAGAAPWCATLQRSFRAADDAGGRAILAVARAIDAGKPGQLTVGPDRAVRKDAQVEPDWRGVELIDPAGVAARRLRLLDRWFARAAPDAVLALARHEYHRDGGAWRDGDAARLDRLLAHHDARRILCATRGLATGADAVNQRLHRALLDRTTVTREAEFLPGEPVILTANDHERGFYNGDTGVIARVTEDGAPRWRVILRRGDELVAVPIDAVRGALEPAWALTVHKSQGSEYDEVMVLLPDERLPIATRELLYTALTRARRGAVVVGAKDIVDAAIQSSAPRHSGLPERVAEALRA